MVTKPKTAPSKKKPPAAKPTSQSIKEETEAFLKAGGKIQHIKSGVSGQENMGGPRHITLGNKSRET